MVFDTQFLRSEAEAVIEAAETATGKPVVAAIVHHANPDKFNGVATFQAHGAAVITSAQILADIPTVHAQRLRAFGKRYAPDFPKDAPEPAVFGSQTQTLRLAGASITLHVLGAGCGAHHVVSQWGGHIFVGDLVSNGAHSWMELGLLGAWQDRLRELAALSAKWVHPGRGPTGDARLLAAQAAYLDELRSQLDAAVVAFGPKDDPHHALEHLRTAITRRYPDHHFAAFLDVALPTLWRRARERRSAIAGA